MIASRSKKPEEQIKRLQDVCGCETGAIVSLVSLAMYVGLSTLFSLGSNLRLSYRVLIGIAVVVIGGLAGKTTAILVARCRLKRLLAEQSTAHRETPADC